MQCAISVRRTEWHTSATTNFMASYIYTSSCIIDYQQKNLSQARTGWCPQTDPQGKPQRLPAGQEQLSSGIADRSCSPARSHGRGAGKAACGSAACMRKPITCPLHRGVLAHITSLTQPSTHNRTCETHQTTRQMKKMSCY